ncbi:MAG: hypothetical protein P8X67_10245 [Syntrophobacterales bacterium]|jgi:hypothetical protein
MNYLLRPLIWPSFLASSGAGSCDLLFRYGKQSRGTAKRVPGGTPILFALATLRSVPQAGSQLRDLATAIHEISGLSEIVLPLTRELQRGDL